MEPGRTVGTGRTADVRAVDSDRVLKQFEASVPFEAVEREAHNTRIADGAGLPVPTVNDVTEVDDRPAIVYERVDGPTMGSRLASRPWTVHRFARRLATLHASIHGVRPSDGRSLRERWARDVDESPGLSPGARRRIRAKLDALPDGSALCHGDFHPENVLLGDDGPVVIDWLDAGTGHPAADVARTSVILRYGGRRGSRVRSLLVRIFRRAYLRAYRNRRDVTREQIREWELPVAAARLAEDVPEASQLRAFIDSRLRDG